MKIISFRDANGESFGVADANGGVVEVEISRIGTLRNTVVDE